MLSARARKEQTVYWVFFSLFLIALHWSIIVNSKNKFTLVARRGNRVTQPLRSPTSSSIITNVVEIWRKPVFDNGKNGAKT